MRGGRRASKNRKDGGRRRRNGFVVMSVELLTNGERKLMTIRRWTLGDLSLLRSSGLLVTTRSYFNSRHHNAANDRRRSSTTTHLIERLCEKMEWVDCVIAAPATAAVGARMMLIWLGRR